MPRIPRRLWLLSLTIPAASAEALEAKEQVAAAMQKLEELTEPENFKKVATGGGDNIRREVGTVGVTSPLFQVDKAQDLLAANELSRGL